MYRKKRSIDLSRAQFDAARLGFFRTLQRKRMSPQFVDRQGEDLFAQACFEYTRRVSEGVVIADPPAWIVTCAWHRTVSLLESRDWRPQLVPIERLGQQADEESGPEEAFLSEDRGRKVREAVEELPGHQRRLLALSYFEGESVREAARRLRWTPSKAQRAHESARRRIQEILGVESTDELQLEIGLFAFLSVVADRAARRALPAGLEAVLDSAHRGLDTAADGGGRLVHGVRRLGSGDPTRLPGRLAAGAHARSSDRGPLRRLGDLGRRLLPGGPGEAGALVAGEGGTRALEVCKGLAVCIVGGGALTGALIGGVHPRPHHLEPLAHHAPAAKVSHHRRHRSGPVSPARSVNRDVTPTTPAPAPIREEPARRSASKTDTAARRETPRVESATPVRVEHAATQRPTPESHVEEQFGDFASTEQGGDSTSAGTDESSIAEANSTAEPTASPKAKTSTSRHGEEAAAAEEFHGLLE